MLSLSWFLSKLCTLFISSSCWMRFTSTSTTSNKMFWCATAAGNYVEEEENKREVAVAVSVSLLDLPDLALECILEKLSAAGLCNAAGVCKALTNRCTSDYLWKKHLKQKWGAVIGAAALDKWRLSSSHIDNYTSSNLNHFIPTSPPNSIIALYLSLQTGNFWFPAQVYNREVQNGHVGFMLSCYDAQVSYDNHTDTFRARYSARGGQTLEENVEWKRLRKPAVDTAPHLLHVSGDDCLTHLKPGDYIEIQWRRSKEFPYGWWFGVVGHLESCNDDDELCCQCHTSESVVLEFKQYMAGSRWRRVVINRKEHREVGNEGDGFYGGITKLSSQQQISTWKQFWTTTSL